jgi:hypothetical protein
MTKRPKQGVHHVNVQIDLVEQGVWSLNFNLRQANWFRGHKNETHPLGRVKFCGV